MRKALRIGLVPALAAVDVVLLAIAIWQGPRRITDGAGTVTDGYNVALAIGATLLVAWAMRWLPLPPLTIARARAFALGAQALHGLGHLARLYYVWRPYDDVLHFLVILGLSLLMREPLILWRLAGRKPRAVTIALAVFLAGTAAAGIWEVFEWTMDNVFGTREQDDLDDTMRDIIDGILGALAAAGWAAFAHRSRRRRGPREPVLEHRPL